MQQLLSDAMFGITLAFDATVLFSVLCVPFLLIEAGISRATLGKHRIRAVGLLLAAVLAAISFFCAPGAAVKSLFSAVFSSILLRTSLYDTVFCTIAVLWFAGAFAGIIRVVRNSHKLKVRIYGLPHMAHHALAAEAARMARVSGRVELIRVGGLQSPCVCGIMRPKVLLPDDFFEANDPQRCRLMLLHEFIHIRRRDTLSFFILSLIKAIFWVHPPVVYILHRLEEAIEMSCDAEALRAGCVDPLDYAKALLCAARAHPSVLPSFHSSRYAACRRRIASLFDTRAQTPWRRAAMPVCALLALAVFALLPFQSAPLPAAYSTVHPVTHERIVVRSNFYWEGMLGSYSINTITPINSQNS